MVSDINPDAVADTASDIGMALDVGDREAVEAVK